MKKQTIIRSLIAMIVLSFASQYDLAVKKKKAQKKFKKAQINEVLPQKYIDTLIRLGITIHEGTTPPIVNGIYVANPTILLASTV
jgi:Na+-translocating ferredoxin:NAD+ oxidoreductase RnfG subunit